MRSARFEVKRGDLTVRGHILGKETGAVKPAVILSHGFLDSEKGTRRYAEKLAEAGFVTFIFDFCGGGIICSSDGKREEMSVLTEVEDLRAVFEYVKSRKYVDSERVSLCGFSQGGFVSALTAAYFTDKVKSLMLVYPAFCIPDDARKGDMGGYKFDPKNIPDLLGTEPMPLGGCYPRALIDMDPYEEIKAYNGPVLIIHGSKDPVVKLSYSDRASKLYKNCQYHIIEGAGHGFGGEDDLKCFKMLTDFAEVNA